MEHIQFKTPFEQVRSNFIYQARLAESCKKKDDKIRDEENIINQQIYGKNFKKACEAKKATKADTTME